MKSYEYERGLTEYKESTRYYTFIK